MTINFPTIKEIKERIQTDVLNQLDEANPFLRASFIEALITGYAGRNHDFYEELQELIKQLFPDTATGDFLRRWGSYINVNPNAATTASGALTLSGSAGAVIPINTLFKTSDNLQYTSNLSKTLASNTIGIISITRLGNTATVTTSHEHELASSINVTIAGATQTAYNGTFSITVLNNTQFSYSVSGSPATPATGTITATYVGATIDVTSTGYGVAYNQTNGTQLDLITPISGVNLSGFVQYDGIAGGTNDELDTDYRTRVLERYRTPITPFNVAYIIKKAKEVPGVTRVFVHEHTPYPGQVTIYFMRDNDNNPIPTGIQRDVVKQKILTIKPAHTEDVDIIFPPITPVTVNFTFTALNPNFATLQAAIKANLEELFAEVPQLGTNLPQYAYESVIYNTADAETGLKVINFTLSTPTGDIAVSAGHIAVLGTVTFPEVE